MNQFLIKLSLFIKDFSDMASFPDNSSYSFHQMRLKLGGQSDNEVIELILFRGNSTPKIDKNHNA